MKVLVTHDSSGHVISIGQANPGSALSVRVQPAEGHSVVAMDLDPEQASLSLLDLHTGYKINPTSKKWIKRFGEIFA